MIAPIKFQLLSDPLRGILFFAVLYLLGFYGYCLLFLYEKQYLPPPFFGNPGDYFMDFYNINFYAAQEYFYTRFASFYSPLNVLIARWFTDPVCVQASTAFAYRACDPISVLVFLGLTWGSTLILMWRALESCQSRTWWFVILGFSFPMAFALERANYLLLAVPVLFFWLGSHARWNFVFEILLANIKYYFMVFQAFYLARNRLLHPLIFFLLLIGVTIALGALTGLSGFGNIPKNLVNFAGGAGGISMLSNTSLDTIAGIQHFFSPSEIGKLTSQLVIGAMKLLICLRIWIYWRETRQEIDGHAFNFVVLLGLLIISSAPGFYGQVLLIPYFIYFLARKCWQGREQLLFILICLPYPFILDQSSQYNRVYLLDGTHAWIPIELVMQTIVQPVLLILFLLSITSRSFWQASDHEKN